MDRPKLSRESAEKKIMLLHVCSFANKNFTKAITSTCRSSRRLHSTSSYICVAFAPL